MVYLIQRKGGGDMSFNRSLELHPITPQNGGAVSLSGIKSFGVKPSAPPTEAMTDAYTIGCHNSGVK